jgi:cell wall-associated NlpC family hydrolase
MKWTLTAIAVLSTACASTGAVPKPFPMPPSSGPPSPAPASGAPATARQAYGRALDAYSLVGTALSLRGTPYRNCGTDPSGFDCSGFTQYVFAQHGVSLPRDVREQFRHGKEVEARDLEPGDLIFFSTTDPGATHVAIVVGGDEFIHAPSSTGVVRVEHLRQSYWSQRFLGARRVS